MPDADSIRCECRFMNPIYLTAIRIASVCAIASFNTAGATEDELARALREDQQLCSTPEGMMYEVKFLAAVSPKAIAAITSCSGSTKNYDFDMAFKVSPDGKITRVVYTPNQPVAACAAVKLKGASGPRPLRGPCTIFGHYSSKPK